MERRYLPSFLAANMFKIVLVAALAALAVDARFLPQAPQPNGRIIGGVNASIEDYPYHAAMQLHDTYHCGGSIIAPVRNLILTAAHCTDPYTDHVTIIKVRYGTSLMHEGGSVRNVVQIFQDSRYNPNTQEYDISLLKLDGYVELSPQVRPIFVVSPHVQEGGRTAYVTGWGQIYQDGPLSPQLKVAEVNEVDREACREVYGVHVNERMICFISEGNGPCMYDSGGPLVSLDRQIGVVSWGPYKCGSGTRPEVYANIHSPDIIDHIAAIITEHGAN